MSLSNEDPNTTALLNGFSATAKSATYKFDSLIKEPLFNVLYPTCKEYKASSFEFGLIGAIFSRFMENIFRNTTYTFPVDFKDNIPVYRLFFAKPPTPKILTDCCAKISAQAAEYLSKANPRTDETVIGNFINRIHAVFFDFLDWKYKSNPSTIGFTQNCS